MSHFYCYYIFKSGVNFKALFICGWPKRIDSPNINSYTLKPQQVFSCGMPRNQKYHSTTLQLLTAMIFF